MDAKDVAARGLDIKNVSLGLNKIWFHSAAFYVGVNHSLTCIARTITILLHVYCARNDAPPTPLLYAIHYTILVMAISCKGQREPYLT